ncbi:alpha-2-HS-glycoprotein-like [Mustelus asterias]
MKLFLALVVSLQLFTSWAVPVNPYVAVACNGPEVLALAELAVDQINKDRKHGYKLSLDRIENAQEKKEANETTVHFLDFDIRETKCHVLSHTAVKDCEIRSFRDTKVDGDCKALVETKAGAPGHVTGYKCETSPDSADDVAEKCADCPHLILLNSTEAQHAAQVSLDDFNKVSNHQHLFAIEEITRASTKGPGTPVVVEYLSRETTCVKGRLECTLNLLISPDRAFCVSTVTPVNATTETIDRVCEFFIAKVVQGSGPDVAPVGEEEHAAAPEGEGGAAPTVVVELEEGATPVAIAEADAAGTEDHSAPSEAPDTETGTPDVEDSNTTPKRKRSVEDSSESSEEIISTAGKQVIHFPDLPADAATCPMKHKYPDDQ